MTQRKLLPAALALAASVTIVGCQVDAATAPVQDDQSALVARLKSSSVALDLESSDIVAITTNSVYDDSYGPENAFDNMPAGGWTQWISDHDFRPFKRASVIQVQYATPKTVRGYTLVGRYESLKDRLPKDWILQGSNDSDATANDALTSAGWTTLDNAVGMDIGQEWKSPTSAAELTRAVARPGAYTHYRLCVTAVNGSSVVDLIEIKMLADSVAVAPPKVDPTPMGDIYTSMGKSGSGIKRITTNSIYSSSYMPGNAFDQMPAGGWTQWISNHDFRPFARASVLQVEYLQPQTVASYTLVGRYESLKDRLPKDWVLQGSNDTGATVLDPLASGKWSELDQATGMEIGDEWSSTTSSARLTRQISAPGSYLKYRLCVTAVNGSSVVDLIEIELDVKKDSVVVEPPVSVDPIYTSIGKSGSGIKTITTNSIYSSSYMPGNAFDQMPAGGWTQWISDHDFRPFSRASVLQVEYLQPQTVASYTLVGRYESLKDRLPKDWVLQGSNDTGASVLDPLASGKWTKLDQAAGMELGDEWNSTMSSARLTRQIPAPGSYLKYRLCVTAVNGSSVVDLIEIEMNP
ncbi:MAG: hypothetical protein RL173_477 [Fibrobacterota bacterium]|jgi:uncharacterized protein (DUF2249 family)